MILVVFNILLLLNSNLSHFHSLFTRFWFILIFEVSTGHHDKYVVELDPIFLVGVDLWVYDDVENFGPILARF